MSETAVKPHLTAQYRDTTEKHKGCAGIMAPSFLCKQCKRNKLIQGRKQVVSGSPKYGYICADCEREKDDEA